MKRMLTVLCLFLLLLSSCVLTKKGKKSSPNDDDKKPSFAVETLERESTPLSDEEAQKIADKLDGTQWEYRKDDLSVFVFFKKEGKFLLDDVRFRDVPKPSLSDWIRTDHFDVEFREWQKMHFLRVTSNSVVDYLKLESDTTMAVASDNDVHFHKKDALLSQEILDAKTRKKNAVVEALKPVAEASAEDKAVLAKKRSPNDDDKKPSLAVETLERESTPLSDGEAQKIADKLDGTQWEYRGDVLSVLVFFKKEGKFLLDHVLLRDLPKPSLSDWISTDHVDVEFREWQKMHFLRVTANSVVDYFKFESDTTMALVPYNDVHFHKNDALLPQEILDAKTRKKKSS